MKDMDVTKPAPPRRYNTRFGGLPHSVIKYKADGTRSDGTRIYNKSSIPNGLYSKRPTGRSSALKSNGSSTVPTTVHPVISTVQPAQSAVNLIQNSVNVAPSAINSLPCIVSSVVCSSNSTQNTVNATLNMVNASSAVYSIPSTVTAAPSIVTSTSSMVTAASCTVTAAPSMVTAAPSTATVAPSTVTAASSTVTAASSTVTAASSTVTAATSTVTSAPSSVTAAPSMVTVAPSTVTAAPSMVTAAPSTVTVAPSTVTVAPSTVTVAPSTVTVAPSTVTVAPSTVTVVPSTVTVAPSTVTVAQGTVTVAPSTVSVTPRTVTASPSTVNFTLTAVYASPSTVCSTSNTVCSTQSAISAPSTVKSTSTINSVPCILYPAIGTMHQTTTVQSLTSTVHLANSTFHLTNSGYSAMNGTNSNANTSSNVKKSGWIHHNSLLAANGNTSATTAVHSVVNTNNAVRRSGWILPKQRLSWDNSQVASYNPKTKMFRCVVCQAVGFMSRIAEHYLGTHCNAKVFQCPQCTYCSAWWRCVRNHMSKHHGVHNAPASMWKSQPLLDEILQMLQNLKYSVDCQDREEKVAENSDKRYICPKCPYATDRRDLYNRHENIHREEKPFQCYVCFKLFNRADHVKKHFYRIHKEHEYDINLIRRLPSKRNRIPVSSSFNGFGYNVNAHSQYANSNELGLFPSVVNNCSSSQSSIFRVLESQLKQDSSFKTELANSSTSSSSTPLLSSYLQSHSPGVNKSSDLISTLLGSPNSSMIWKQKQQQKAFQCLYCPWKGVDGWCLRRHLNTHSKPFSCSLCDYKSSRGERLGTHMLNVHGKQMCNKCRFLADSDTILDAHMKEAHGLAEKVHVGCKFCPEGFESLSDLEAHYYFIHKQSLLHCSHVGCDFYTTESSLLECHRNEKHSGIFQGPVDDSVYSSWDTLCLYCGCDFANVSSLQIHLELFHENPLQLSSPRRRDPYYCTVCSYTTPTQRMMMEHMRIHSGHMLQCEAGGCWFRTPYDSVLREHVLQMHAEDEGIVRCPHCGHPCSTRYSFSSHYQQSHHPVACHMCKEVEYKHFLYFDNSAASGTHLSSSVIPFVNNIVSSKINGNNIASSEFTFTSAPIVTPISTQSTSALRRSRKQSQPRKIVQSKFNRESVGTDNCSIYSGKSISDQRIESFPSFYREKARKLSRAPLLRCRYCYKRPLYFRHKRNLFLHVEWYHTKFYPCHKCSAYFHHRYQVVLHNRKEHREEQDS